MTTLIIQNSQHLAEKEEEILASRSMVLGFNLGTEKDRELLPLMRRMKECLVPIVCTINMDDPVRAMKTFLDAADLVNEVRLLRIPAKSLLHYGLKPYQRMVISVKQIAEKRGINVTDGNDNLLSN